jgi:hypothetical protein
MRNVYRVLAYAVAALVAVQAASIAYAFFGLGTYIDHGASSTRTPTGSRASAG